jgi:ankyrin repeat protein
VEAFVVAATSGRRERAEALLRAHPEIERDPWAALVLGRGWSGDTGAPGGPRGWHPLAYVCHSCFASADLARELLDRGADPNASFVNEYGRMSALYGAAGVVHDPELTRVLLEARANPDDNESLYHATEAGSTACLELLLEHGATIRGTNALPHALDADRLEHVRLLLNAGADPNEGAYVAHAVRRGRGPEFIRLLAEHGADVDRPGGETWRGDVPLRTPYQHAVIRGRADVAETLEELGVSTDVSAADESLAAIARGESPTASLPSELDPDAQEALILAALGDRLDAVAAAVGLDFQGVVGGSPRGSLLCHAAWLGDASLVGELLGRGADPHARADARFDTPLAWAAHGSFAYRSQGRDYVAVAEQLDAAGSSVRPYFLEAAEGPLYDWIEARLTDRSRPSLD